MSDTGIVGRNRGSQASYGANLSTDGRWAIALGIVALVLGCGAIGAGVYIGFWMAALPLGLSGVLADVPTETIAMVMVVTGGLTTMLGGISLQKAQDM